MIKCINYKQVRVIELERMNNICQGSLYVHVKHCLEPTGKDDLAVSLGTN